MIHYVLNKTRRLYVSENRIPQLYRRTIINLSTDLSGERLTAVIPIGKIVHTLHPYKAGVKYQRLSYSVEIGDTFSPFQAIPTE